MIGRAGGEGGYTTVRAPVPAVRVGARRLRIRSRFRRGRPWRPLALLASPLLAAAALVVGGGADAQSSRLGEENSWVRVQNLGGAPATVDVTFYDPAGKAIATDRCPGSGCAAIPPGSGWSFFQQGFEDLPTGYRGSAYLTVDQPFVAILARDVFDGNRFRIGGDTLRHAGNTDRQYLPLVQNMDTYVSRISIENTSEDRAACVAISYYGTGSSAAAVVDPPGSTPGCPSGGHLLAPRATLLRDETNLPVPLGFDGSAVVSTRPTGSGVAATDQQIAATVDTRERRGPGLATYRALDGSELSRVIALPLADRNASEGQTTWSTRFRIVSERPELPNEVSLLFEGVDGAGADVEVEHTITVRGSRTCDQRRTGDSACLPAGESLPATFFGTVRIQSVEPVAVVAQRISANGPLADYRGFTAEEAARQVVLPVLNKNFGPFGDARGWNSWFRVFTFDGSQAHVRVIYYSKEFPNGLVDSPVTVDRQRTFRQWEHRRLPDGWVGSAIIISDRPIVAVANLESDVFAGDPVMLYNGIGFD